MRLAIPVDENKPNQDAFSITEDFTDQPTDAFFAVFDGHGRDGNHCANFARDNLSRVLAKQIKMLKQKQLAASAAGVETINDIELNKQQLHDVCSKSHVVVNKAMHATTKFEDALSGTTAISAVFQGKRNRVTISNVGDSRAILGKRVKEDEEEKLVPFEEGAIYRAIPLSTDQTPYRKVERKRILASGARILSLDQIEGLEPLNNDDDDDDGANDLNLGEEIDEGGDPPRVWHPTMDYPGTAFTRSLGDALAEALGVIAEPEMVTRELEEGDEIIVLASDGVFEFLTNQSVIDICTKFKDPLEACKAVISEAYELWLQYELRTDDITMICIFVDGVNKQAAENYSARASIANLHADIPDNIMIDTDPKIDKDDGKFHKRLAEMKVILEQALQDGPNGKEIDLDKISLQKTDEENEMLLHACKGSVMMQSMSPEQLNKVISVMQPVDVKKGEWIIHQGEVGDRFYIIEDGEFEVRVRAGGSTRIATNDGSVVHTYRASKDKKIHPSFGELALLYSAPRAASVIALRDCKLWALDRSALKAIMLNGARKELVDVLRSIPELASYTIEEIEEFSSAMEEVSFKKNEKLITWETRGNALYVISEGAAEISLQPAAEGGDSLTSALERLDFFGQEVMSSKVAHYLTTVEALSDVVCWKLDKGRIAHIMKKMQAVREGRSSL